MEYTLTIKELADLVRTVKGKEPKMDTHKLELKIEQEIRALNAGKPVHDTITYMCANCKSKKVETKHWVAINTLEVGDTASDGETDDNWCPDCQTHPRITYE